MRERRVSLDAAQAPATFDLPWLPPKEVVFKLLPDKRKNKSIYLYIYIYICMYMKGNLHWARWTFLLPPSGCLRPKAQEVELPLCMGSLHYHVICEITHLMASSICYFFLQYSFK